jgi:trehalose 6-phosphate synthase
MGRLVIASNRVGDFKSGFQAGGLAVALCGILRSRGGLWFGTTEVEGGCSLADAKAIGDDGSSGVENVKILNVPINSEAYDEYYRGFSNSVLWPVFHNRLDIASFDNDTYRTYRQVNKRFAEAMVHHLRPDDTIWVHDYHLIPLGSELRKLNVGNPIGFFLHIPFPNAEVATSISQHRELGHNLAEYDLVGFQTKKDTRAFIDFVQRHLNGQILNDGRLRIGERTIECGSFPVGIDTLDFARVARNARYRKEDRAAFPANPGISHIIGVDRLDYTKGLLQRFEAFEKFLSNNPERHGKVNFIQIAPPTRQGLDIYKDFEEEIARRTGSINGRFGDLEWLPVRYLHKAFPRDRLAALYRGAKIGLVTPIQDGMNLVAKEYVAAQDPHDPGVLVLSRFAGAAEELKGALIVNPYDVDQLASAIENALNMPLEERMKRHRSMSDRISKYDIHSWRDVFTERLEASARRRRALTYHPPLARQPRRDFATNGKRPVLKTPGVSDRAGEGAPFTMVTPRSTGI